MVNNEKKPNVIILYADDLGYGDVGCYGGTHIPTPNIDRLAKQGLRFTQGYAAAATCTPSRYSILTGVYPWRNANASILPGDAPLLIEPGSPTLPGMLQGAGYFTGVVGKWHLGLGSGCIDWNHEIEGTPLDVGFDYSYIMASTNDRVPCVYVDGREVVNLDQSDPIEVSYQQTNPFTELPTGRANPELLRMRYSHGHDMSIINGISRIGYMRGGKSALWSDEQMAEVFLEKAIAFITERKDTPFFLYYAFHQPHVPRVPGPKFAGVTGLGPRGDVIAEMDWLVGEVLNTLDKLGLADDTLIIFSSDNGPVLDDGYFDQAVELNGDHKPAGPLRGGKYSMYDGGTRVPMIASWPKTITPGESSALISHIDIYASLANLVGQPLESDAALDSVDLLDPLLGLASTGREELVLEGIKTKNILRRDQWVFIPPYKGPAVNQNVGIELGNAAYPQLYNVSDDLSQNQNISDDHPKLVSAMSKRLDEILASSKTR